MTEQRYLLGSEAEELERLDRQAASIERPTRQLLQASGIAPGMRALDLGTGLGHVARILGELVGPTGSVIGLDNVAGVLAAARQQTDAAGSNHVTLTQGDVTTWRAESSSRGFRRNSAAVSVRLTKVHRPESAR